MMEQNNATDSRIDVDKELEYLENCGVHLEGWNYISLMNQYNATDSRTDVDEERENLENCGVHLEGWN